MALERTPLESSLLSPAAQRALSAGPVKMMAARGLAPLPNPGDMVAVLYQLSLDPDTAIQQAANKTSAGLPDRVLDGALSDPRTDPRVLDYFAQIVNSRFEMLQRIIVNQSTHGATIAELAGRLGTDDIDLIAQNEQRLLAYPEIVGAMFHNRHARMSTVDRAVELAARHGLTISSIPNWESMAKAAIGERQTAASTAEPTAAEEDVDGVFAAVVADPEDRAEDEEEESKSKGMPNFALMTIPQKIRAATLGNKFIRAVLIRDANKMVATAAIKAPGVTDLEAAKYASNQSLSEDVIRYIVGKREWTKNYGIKLSLVLNPKTPIADAIRLIPHLRKKDLKTVARSKNIPAAVSVQAKKMSNARNPKK